MKEEEFLNEIKALILNIPSLLTHNNMSTATKNEIDFIKKELTELKNEAKKGNDLDIEISSWMKTQTLTLNEIKDSLKNDYVKNKEFILEKENLSDKIKTVENSIKGIKNLGYVILSAVLVDIVSRLINVAY